MFLSSLWLELLQSKDDFSSNVLPTQKFCHFTAFKYCTFLLAKCYTTEDKEKKENERKLEK